MHCSPPLQGVDFIKSQLVHSHVSSRACSRMCHDHGRVDLTHWSSTCWMFVGGGHDVTPDGDTWLRMVCLNCALRRLLFASPCLTLMDTFLFVRPRPGRLFWRRGNPSNVSAYGIHFVLRIEQIEHVSGWNLGWKDQRFLGLCSNVFTSFDRAVYIVDQGHLAQKFHTLNIVICTTLIVSLQWIDISNGRKLFCITVFFNILLHLLSNSTWSQ